MTKAKAKALTLYDHNTVETVHRNLTVVDNGRQQMAKTNTVESPYISVAPPPAASFLYDEPLPNEPYSYDDDHFPAHPDNSDQQDTIKVTATHKAKRYQNSVSFV